MIHNTTCSIFLCFIVIALISCERKAIDEDDIILAEVGNRILLLNDLKEEISAEQYAHDSLAIINQYRNRWINRQLKVREAKRLGLDQHEEIHKRIQQATESILVDAFNEVVYLELSGEPVSRSEAQAYYETNKDNFVLGERHVRFRHLVASNLSDAQNALNDIHRGRSWRDIVENYSINPEQALVNSRRYWPISNAASEYEPLNNFLQIIGITEISPIRRIGDQFHFVQLMDSRSAGEHPQIEWIIDQITEWLMLERKRRHLRAMEQNLFLRAEANNELRLFDVREPEQELEIRTDSLLPH
ncbi:MAG: hypothetical protein WD097_04610 [Balneolales bacterium]